MTSVVSLTGRHRMRETERELVSEGERDRKRKT